MELVQTINAVAELAKAVGKLAPLTQVTENGSITINSYNTLASALNGNTYNLLDTLAVVTPMTVTMGLVVRSSTLSTDDYNTMRLGLESIKGILHAAVRTEGSENRRAAAQDIKILEVKRLVTDIAIRSQLSENPIANYLEVDLGRLDPEVTSTESIFMSEKLEYARLNGAVGANGGGYIAILGFADGNAANITFSQGRPGQMQALLTLEKPTSGSLNLIPTPVAGSMMLPPTLGRAPVVVDQVDVSSALENRDVVVEFLLNNIVQRRSNGLGAHVMPVCDTVVIGVTAWDMAKQANPCAVLNNWNNNNGAQKQPAVAIQALVSNAVSHSDYMTYGKWTCKPDFMLEFTFNEGSFRRVPPNVTWDIRSMLANTGTDQHWSRFIAIAIAAASCLD